MREIREKFPPGCGAMIQQRSLAEAVYFRSDAANRRHPTEFDDRLLIGVEIDRRFIHVWNAGQTPIMISLARAY